MFVETETWRRFLVISISGSNRMASGCGSIRTRQRPRAWTLTRLATAVPFVP